MLKLENGGKLVHKVSDHSIWSGVMGSWRGSDVAR